MGLEGSEGERRGSFELVRTFAGHLAVLDHDTREIMHPIVGPVDECMKLYGAPSRLAERLSAPPFDEPLVLLDVGLGGGSNVACALSISAALSGPRRRLEIHSFDRSIDALLLAADAPQAFGFDAEMRAAASALSARPSVALAHCTWTFHPGELPDSLGVIAPGSADLVFWDMFSPRSTPSVWSLAAFQAVHALCRPGASVHTYSGATATRTALLLAGFWVGYGPVVGEKKRATIAVLEPGVLTEPLPLAFPGRVSRSSAAFCADAPPDALTRINSHPQFRGALSIAAPEGSA